MVLFRFLQSILIFAAVLRCCSGYRVRKHLPVLPRHRQAGTVCKCKLVPDAECYKPLLSSDVCSSAGSEAMPCRRDKCETYVCDDDGNLSCIEKALKCSLSMKEYGICSVHWPRGGTYLTPIDADVESKAPYLSRPATYDFIFAGTSKCMILHSEKSKLATEDPAQVYELIGLPVGSCEPIKVKCIDGSSRLYRRKRDPGPVAMGMFVSNGIYYGSGVDLDRDYALSSKKTGRKYCKNKYRAKQLIMSGFDAPLLSVEDQAMLYMKYPSWKAKFVADDGRALARALTVRPPYRMHQRGTFVFTPPYCTFPYIQDSE